MKLIDYYFALASPWSYLGHERLMAIAARTGATLAHKPIDHGRAFPAAGTLRLRDRPPARKAYRLVELKRWRDHLKIPLVIEPKYFPVDERLAAHMVVAARQGGYDAGALSLAFMRALWVHDQNIADRETLDRIAETLGFVGLSLRASAESIEVEAEYDSNTEEAIARQVFGLPFYIFRGEPFWGQDRLEFLERALRSE
jgi:2-hydroxychromene-2-carboxylate isomerase